MRGDVEDLLAHGFGREPRGAAREHGAAARIGSGAAGDGRAVAMHDAHILDAHAEMLGHDLGQRGLQALAMGGDAERRGDRAGRIDADGGGLGAGVDRHAGRDRDARADAGQLGVAGDADAEPAAGRAEPPPACDAGRHSRAVSQAAVRHSPKPARSQTMPEAVL